MLYAWGIMLAACFFQGSFGMCFKKYRPFSWEAFWLLFSVTGIGILPHLWTAIEVPGYMGYIAAADIKSLLTGSICGLLWGISAACYSRAIDKIGVSLVTGINMGLSNIFGCFVPMYISGIYPEGPEMIRLLIGQAVILCGGILLMAAGCARKKEIEGAKAAGEHAPADIKSSGKGRETGKGIFLAAASGLGSACLNIGMSAAAHPAKIAVSSGVSEGSASMLSWIVILSGGFIANFVYALWLVVKNKSCRDYKAPGCVKVYVKIGVTAAVWFIPLALFGRARIALGDMGSSAGWLIFNSGALVIANLWAVKDKEWKGSKKAVKIALAGNIVIFCALFLLC